MRLLVYTPFALAYGVTLPLRVWWRVRRRGTPNRDLAEAMAAEFRAIANGAYSKMSPEMRAEIDAERRAESD